MAEYSGKKRLFAFCMLGFLFGVIVAGLTGREYICPQMSLSKAMLKNYDPHLYSTWSYFWYLLKLRVLPAGVILLVGKRRLWRAAIPLFLFGTGFFTGTFIVLSVMQLGGYGLLFCAVTLLPHMLLYFAAYTCILMSVSSEKSRWKPESRLFTGMLFVLGLLSEFYLSPVLLKHVCGFIK